jgi:hypothetical protein
MTLPAQIFLNIRLAAWRPCSDAPPGGSRPCCAAGRVAAALHRRAGAPSRAARRSRPQCDVYVAQRVVVAGGLRRTPAPP